MQIFEYANKCNHYLLLQIFQNIFKFSNYCKKNYRRIKSINFEGLNIAKKKIEVEQKIFST